MKSVIVLKHASSRAHAPLPRSVLHIGPPPLCRRASSVRPVLWEEKGVERVAQARFRRHPLDATLFACLHGRPTSHVSEQRTAQGAVRACCVPPCPHPGHPPPVHAVRPALEFGHGTANGTPEDLHRRDDRRQGAPTGIAEAVAVPRVGRPPRSPGWPGQAVYPVPVVDGIGGRAGVANGCERPHVLIHGRLNP